jgi:hypothetical protein
MMNPTERTGNLIIIAVLFGIGLFCVIASRMMPGGQFGEMGPGFFPGLLGTILAGISLVLGIEAFFKDSAKNRVRLAYRDGWSIVGATVLVAVMFKPLGFMPSIGLFVFFNLRLLSHLGWIKCILVSAAAAAAAYLLFDSLLGIQLPMGDWL